MFQNPGDGRNFPLKHYVNCKTVNVMYGLICTCPCLYIGQTSQQLKKRVQKHLSTLALAPRDRSLKKKLTAVAEHFLDKQGGSLEVGYLSALIHQWCLLIVFCLIIPHPNDVIIPDLMGGVHLPYSCILLLPNNGLNQHLKGLSKAFDWTCLWDHTHMWLLYWPSMAYNMYTLLHRIRILFSLNPPEH